MTVIKDWVQHLKQGLGCKPSCMHVAHLSLCILMVHNESSMIPYATVRHTSIKYLHQAQAGIAMLVTHAPICNRSWFLSRACLAG